MDYIKSIVDEYFSSNPIDIDRIKINYKLRNKIKLIDDNTSYVFSLGINLAKLYIKN